MVSELNLLNVDTRVKQLKMNHVHKIVNNKGPSYMKEHFLNVSEIHKYQTRSNEHNFFISQCQGPKSQTFYYSAIKDWNDLPDHLKGIQNKAEAISTTVVPIRILIRTTVVPIRILICTTEM